MRAVTLKLGIFFLSSMLGVFDVDAQRPASFFPEKKTYSQAQEMWFGFYTKYHFNDKWAYYGEYHMRRRNWLEDMGQVYLRVGATYTLQKYLDFTAGIAFPLYWAPQGSTEVDRIVPQYRFWQQAVLATPFEHIKLYHQLRLEQRWRRDYAKQSPYELTYRFRYKMTLYVPLNKPAFENHTLFLAFYNEIFIQTGKSIVFNHMEDNRSYAGIGYNLSEQFQIQGGYMFSYRHKNSPFHYEKRSIVRLSLYHHLDLHLNKHREDRPIPIH